MIIGIGVDAVEVSRFSKWHLFSHKQLRRIFSDAEIDYCKAVPAKSAERFAVRFAAREAFFKALCQMMVGAQFPFLPPFLMMCRHVHVSHDQQGVPFLMVDWPELLAGNKILDNMNSEAHEITVLLSLSHAQTVAIAMVVLQKG